MSLLSWQNVGRRHFIAGIGALLVAGAGGATGAQPKSTILVFGDSLSAEYGLRRGTGWVALLEQRLEKESVDARVVNASISGETTSGGRSRLEALLKVHRPDVVVLELGANDALRGLPMANTEENLLQMTRASQDAGAKVLVLGMQVPPNYGSAYADRFAATFGNVAKQTQAALVPFFLKNVADVPAAMELFQADRIHPNDRAQSILLDNVWPQLVPLLTR
ncbi:MAG: arylesterase [Rhodoferax sp.]